MSDLKLITSPPKNDKRKMTWWKGIDGNFFIASILAGLSLSIWLRNLNAGCFLVSLLMVIDMMIRRIGIVRLVFDHGDGK